MLDPAGPISAVEQWILDVFHVPAAPQPPEGSPGSIQVFRAGRNFYTFSLTLWCLANVAILVFLLFLDFAGFRVVMQLPEWIRLSWNIIVCLDLLAFAATLPVTFLAQQLNYKLRWYMVTDRSLRIRSGIFSMQEMTMTFSNIQEIRVTANPLQNILGIATVEVHSAGGGSGEGESGHVGRFEGVSNANEIRDLMVDRLRQYRDSGLGEAAKPAAPTDGIEAARTVLAEVRNLRAAFEQSA